MTIRMLDSINPANLPPGAGAYLGYVGGRWVTFPVLQRLFPHAHLLSMAIAADEDAEGLDVEAGDATPAEAPGWVARQQKRGVWRPVVYANASTMPAVADALGAARIRLTAVRLLSAHYTYKAHICGPHSCAALPFDADGTQWTNQAPGQRATFIDESLLLDSFFPAPAPTPEDIMISGQVTGQKTDIVLPDGITELRFGCSEPAIIQVDLRDGKPETTLDLTYKSTESVKVPAGVHMVVAHVKTPAPDGTAAGYAGW